MRFVACLVLFGCGRLDFSPVAGNSVPGDAVPADATRSAYAAVVLADGPLAYYRLDELAGTTAVDASGHAFDASYFVDRGTLSYGVSGALAGDPDPALALMGAGNSNAGTAAAVQIPPEAYAFNSDFTIEAWIKPSIPPVGWRNAFFIWEKYLMSGFRTGWGSGFAPEFWTNEGGGTSDLLSPTPLVAGAWNHLVYTKAGATVTIYLAGQVATSGAVNYLTPPTVLDDCLGSAHGMPSSAVFDEFAIYAYALTPAQIAAHYAVGTTAP